jgi:MFS family permease
MSLLPIDPSTLREHPSVRVWRNRQYARYMGGLGPYYVTHWMQRIAVGWLTWELTHSYAWVGIIAAAELFPMILLGPLAGAMADRHDPLKQTQWAQLLLAIEGAVLAAATIAGVVNIWLLLALALISGAIQPVATACRQLVLPATIPREDFAAAISLDSTSFHGSRFVGPAIAAFMIPVTGVGGPLVAHVVGTLWFWFQLTRLDLALPDRRSARSSSIGADIVDGFRYASRHAGLWPLFMMLTICSLLARPLQELLPGFAGGVLESGASGLAWLTSSMGIGSMAASAFLAIRGHAGGLSYLVILSCFGLGISTFGMVATRELGFAVMFAAPFGFSLTLMGVGIQAMAQIAVADEMRGRVMILYVIVYRGVPAVGALVIGLLSELIGMRSAFAFAAAACIAAWLVIAPRHRTIDRALQRQPADGG